VRTPIGIECHNSKGATVGSVRVGEDGLIFDPDFQGSEYEESSPPAKLKGWIEFVMHRDTRRRQEGRQTDRE
jgi:hypothetical protein